MALSDMIGLVAILRNRGVNPSICAAIQEYAAILCSRLRAVHIQNRLGLRQHHIHMAPVRPCHGGSASRAAAIVVVTLNGRAAPFYQCANIMLFIGILLICIGGGIKAPVCVCTGWLGLKGNRNLLLACQEAAAILPSKGSVLKSKLASKPIASTA